MKFEGPDRLLVRAWLRPSATRIHAGSYNSEEIFGSGAARKARTITTDRVAGLQGWCNGKVEPSGNSYLAISHRFAAAEQPPHLAGDRALGRP